MAKSLISVALLSICNFVNAQQLDIYNSDSTLTIPFIESLCQAAKETSDSEPHPLEILFNKAAGTSFKAPEQSRNIFTWWSRYFGELYCRVKRKKELHVGRLIIENDIRLVANQLGPHGRLSINVEIKDMRDSLTLHDYAKREREAIQARYNNRTLKFQENKRWKNYTFYMLLFTEYEVQWAVFRDENGK